jgi:hypothetical protein
VDFAEISEAAARLQRGLQFYETAMAELRELATTLKTAAQAMNELADILEKGAGKPTGAKVVPLRTVTPPAPEPPDRPCVMCGREGKVKDPNGGWYCPAHQEIILDELARKKTLAEDFRGVFEGKGS